MTLYLIQNICDIGYAHIECGGKNLNLISKFRSTIIIKLITECIAYIIYIYIYIYIHIYI